MYSWGRKSKEKLATCDSRLVEGLTLVLSWGIMDIAILYGHRDPFEQFKLYQKGREEVNGEWVIANKSKVVTTKDGFKKPSKHNYSPSLATDFAPFIGGKIIIGKTRQEVNQICVLAGIVQAAFRSLGIPFTWGGNWDRDGEPLTDQTFNDLLHIQVPRILNKEQP